MSQTLRESLILGQWVSQTQRESLILGQWVSQTLRESLILGQWMSNLETVTDSVLVVATDSEAFDGCF